MRTVAFRSIGRSRAEGLVKAAAIAMSMVLVDCNGLSQNEARQVSVTTLEAQDARVRAEPVPAELKRSKKETKSDAGTQKTMLDLSYYSNLMGSMVVEARLSIIRPDNTLEVVILDPKVKFEYAYESDDWRGIPACRATHSCKVDSVVRKKGKACIRARFIPDEKSNLEYSDIMIEINVDGTFKDGCPNLLLWSPYYVPYPESRAVRPI